MNQYLEDAFLYRYMPEAEAAMLSAIPPEGELGHSFSRRFRRKMEALLRYERRSGFGRFAAGFGRIAAAVLIALLAVNTVLVCSVEAYRESFYEIIETVTEKFTSFFVEVDENAPVTEFVPIDPPYIPEGFAVTERSTIGDIGQIIYYSDNEGKSISFTQALLGLGLTYFDTEDALNQKVLLCDCKIQVMIEGEMIQAYWVSSGHEFVIVSNVKYEEVMTIIEKILENLKK